MACVEELACLVLLTPASVISKPYLSVTEFDHSIYDLMCNIFSTDNAGTVIMLENKMINIVLIVL